MAKMLKDSTAKELPAIFETVRNIQQQTRTQPRRRIRSLGGGGTRAYVVITNNDDGPAEYVGDVINGPDDPTVKTADVVIKVSGATANDFEVGYSNFADKSGDVFYLSGGLLG